MNFKEYLKYNIGNILLNIMSLIFLEVFLLSIDNELKPLIIIAVIWGCVLFGYLIIAYIKRKDYFIFVEKCICNIDKKYLISEVLEVPPFIEAKPYYFLLKKSSKAMREEINKEKLRLKDYKEYIELWIHEIKLPIAAGKMIIENNKSEVTESINEELDKIENYIEQALFYASSNTVEKDYYIKKVNLKEIVNSSIIKNKRNLIQNKINIDAHDINTIVYTDHKWCMFILSQIIQNAVKYSKEDSKKIEIYSEIKKENTILYIKDNGIGIRKGEITRVFEKGFTGENGRKRGQKATGIGLYLCKKLCNKLGLGLELNSEKDVGTEVKIVFPKSSFISETF